jgi:ribosome maturation factor RimP
MGLRAHFFLPLTSDHAGLNAAPKHRPGQSKKPGQANERMANELMANELVANELMESGHVANAPSGADKPSGANEPIGIGHVIGASDLHTLVERTIGPLGYELVDIEYGQRSTLRVFIDAPAGIRLEDCETVSRQLSHVFAVEDIDYDRLEVSSPGLDRPLRRARDFERFASSRVTLRLRQAFQGRRNFEGILTVEEGGRFGLELVVPDTAKPRGGPGGTRSKRPSAKSEATEPQSVRKLVFSLDEVERARLVPIVKF